MRMSVRMEKEYGDYQIKQYSVSVQRSDEKVWFELFNHEIDHMQNGGKFIVPIEVAAKLGQALILMSDPSRAGLPLELRLRFDESRPDLTSRDQDY